MEVFNITQAQEQLRIEGFPDAVKVLKLEGPKAKRLADLALHKDDLEFALRCLEEINSVPNARYVIRQALWRSAVVHFMKCFGSSESRSSLVAKKIYKNNPEAIEAYGYFASLRNKHLVHDENSWSQCMPGAILNKDHMDHKIAKIVCLAIVADTLDQSTYSNLHLLVTQAKDWVVAQFDELCVVLTSELEPEKYENLFAREGIVYTAPKVEEVHGSRSAK